MSLTINKMTTVKMLYGVTISWLIQFITPLASFLIFTTCLVLVDLYTGVQAAKKRGEVIHSKGFRRSITKISLYFAAVLLARGMEIVFLSPKGFDFDLTYIVAGLIALTEFKSNLENISTVTGVPFWEKITEKIPSLNDFYSKKKDDDNT
jgi:phage-related holin